MNNDPSSSQLNLGSGQCQSAESASPVPDSSADTLRTSQQHNQSNIYDSLFVGEASVEDDDSDSSMTTQPSGRSSFRIVRSITNAPFVEHLYFECTDPSHPDSNVIHKAADVQKYASALEGWVLRRQQDHFDETVIAFVTQSTGKTPAEIRYDEHRRKEERRIKKTAGTRGKEI